MSLPTEIEALDKRDMQRLSAGCDLALNRLMERHAGNLLKYLIRSLRNEQDAKDAAQETFVRVYQNRHKFDYHQKFSTWVYAIAANLVKDRYRYRTRHLSVSLDAGNSSAGVPFGENLPEAAATPSESIEAAERAEAIRKALAIFPEELRAPLVLSEYEELSHAEIGGILKCSAKAVEARIYRARKRLRIMLGKLVEST